MSHVIGHQTYSYTERKSFCQSCFVLRSILGGFKSIFKLSHNMKILVHQCFRISVSDERNN